MRRSSDLADGHAELIEVIVEDDYGSRTRALECVREVFCSFATSDFGARRSGSRIQRIHQHLSPSPTCYISFSCTPTFSVMPPIGITTTLRRNGKLQSCEPCRKRKLSCDHKLPFCGRCVKRGTQQDCHYHPAPMTRSRRGSQVPSSPARTNPTRREENLSELPPATAAPQEPAMPHLQWFNPQAELHESVAKTVVSPLGYIGESSASTIVAELMSSLGETPAEAVHAHNKDNITEAMIQKGAAVLYHLQGLESPLQHFLDWMIESDGYLLFRPVYNIFVSSTWRYLGSTLREVPHGERLRTLSRLVWENTQKPIRVSGDTTVEQWVHQATGENLRWETVGLLFAAVGLNVHHQLGHPTEQASIEKLMLRLVDECLDNSRICGSSTDLFVCLLYERSPLVEQIRGDISPEAWNRFSDVCNTALELGLHKEKVVDAKTPFFLCELRIRIFEAIYVHDKYVSTYLGRPPRICYRHCIVQSPADLSDDEVCGDQTKLAEAISKLDNGYARTGRIYRATMRRAQIADFIIREEILEIVLGNPHSSIDSRVHEIRDRIQKSGEEMPVFLRVNPEQILDRLRTSLSFEIPGRNAPWRSRDIFWLLAIHCERRYTDFLLERALVRRSKVDPAKLIAAARSMLDLTLKWKASSEYFHNQGPITERVRLRVTTRSPTIPDAQQN